MKRLNLIVLLGLMLPFGVWAQDEAESTFTDEELTSYATVMKWAEDQKAILSSVVTDSIKVWMEGSELTAGLYNELSKALKSGTIEAVEASENAKATFQEISMKIDDKKAVFKETYTTKIKEDIGAGLYNKLKKALKSDADLKTRYDAILAALGSSSEESEADSN
jgi:hypothetical protein